MNIVKNKNNFALFFITFLTSFLLGIIVAFSLGNNINNDLLKNGEEGGLINILNNKENLNLDKFWEVYKLIKNNKYGSEGINNDDLVESAIKGLVDGLGDKHSEYLTIDENEQFNEALSGNFEGIGAVVAKNELGVFIERIFKGSPAKKYGIKSGDIIINANGVKLEGLNLVDAVSYIKGPAGTNVSLEIIRSGESNILTIDVIRDKIKIPSINTEVFGNGKIAYIAINMFGENTAREFKKALNDNMDSEGLIIDLRDNGGGYLQSAVEILSNMVENDKTLVVTKYKRFLSNVSYPSINNGDIYKGKIVVLINENSASASEITAGALKDYNKAILVGVKSYGKGSVQKPFNLNDGSMLKLTIAKWFTPNDVNIDHEGIIPDIEIEFKKEDYIPKEGEEKDFEFYDRQLEEAKKVLDIFIKNEAVQLSIEEYRDKNNIGE